MEKTLDIGGDLVSTADHPVAEAGVIGCGSHAFRNVYPALQFAPVDLVATCDLDPDRAAAYADEFGAARSYTDYRELVEDDDLDAVLAVLDYDDEGRPKYPEVATEAMRAGLDVWIEKPPAASADRIEELMRVEAETGQFVHVGYKKVYNPAIEKAKEYTERDEFGAVDTISLRYPISPPDREHPGEERTHDSSLTHLLDHLVHPGSIATYLGGPISEVATCSSDGPGGFVTLEFESGATGTIHMAAGSSGSSPLDRVEVVGDGANVVVENGIELTYYRPYDRGPYGRTRRFSDGEGEAPVRWVPEFSLGQLYNKGLFTLGYAHELRAFAECCLEGRRPQKAGLEASREQLKLYEAVLRGENEFYEL